MWCGMINAFLLVRSMVNLESYPGARLQAR